MVKELAMIMVQEAIKLHCTFQGSEQESQKNSPGSKSLLVSTNYGLSFEVQIPLLFSIIDLKTSARIVAI